MQQQQQQQEKKKYDFVLAMQIGKIFQIIKHPVGYFSFSWYLFLIVYIYVHIYKIGKCGLDEIMKFTLE